MRILKSLSLFSVALLFSFLAESCSKEKKIERTLHKKDGEWTISSVTWQKVLQSGSGQTVTMGTSTNAGTFTFEKDGSGKYNFTIDGDNYSKSFNWTVSNETFSITAVSQNYDFSTGDVIQTAVAFSGTKNSKKKLIIEGSETYQSTSGSSVTQEVLTGTFELTKE
jgi:hypothetical protein